MDMSSAIVVLYIMPLMLVILCTKVFQVLAKQSPADAKTFAGLGLVPFLNWLVLAFELIAIVCISLEWSFNKFYGDEQ